MYLLEAKEEEEEEIDDIKLTSDNYSIIKFYVSIIFYLKKKK